MKDFVTSAKGSIGVKRDAATATTFKIDDREVTFYEPTPGQASIMMTMGTRDLDLKAASLFMQMLFDLMDLDTQRYIQTRLLDPDDPFELESEGGIFDIWEALVDEWSAKKPIKEPSDYQPPRRATGKGSTGTSRARASTSSTSRSTRSSR